LIETRDILANGVDNCVTESHKCRDGITHSVDSVTKAF